MAVKARGKMVVVDALCPDCALPMIPLGHAEGWLGCIRCEHVWRLRRTILVPDWEHKTAKPRADGPRGLYDLDGKHIDTAFREAMEGS